jgi:hypothetical protein
MEMAFGYMDISCVSSLLSAPEPGIFMYARFLWSLRHPVLSWPMTSGLWFSVHLISFPLTTHSDEVEITCHDGAESNFINTGLSGCPTSYSKPYRCHCRIDREIVRALVRSILISLT